MVFDKVEHQQVIIAMINTASIKGAAAEFIVELKNAVNNAEIKEPPNKKADAN